MNNRVLSNWSGDLAFHPTTIEMPSTVPALQRVINDARAQRTTVRALGAGHSCAPIAATDQVIVDGSRFKGLVHHDLQNHMVTIGAGNTVEETGKMLFDLGLGMENTGHIDKQVMAGAISTGTHGAGKKLTNLSGQVMGIKMVAGNGEAYSFNHYEHPAMMKALRVSLGSLGIFTELSMKVLPVFQLYRRQYCASIDDCLFHLDHLMEENRNFCFYWYPRRDDVSIRLWNEPGKGMQYLPYAKMYKELFGWGKDILPSEQQLKFNELEYSFDLETAPEVFMAVRKRVLQRHRQQVAWRILYRPVAGDDAWLSNAYGKNIVAITVHHHAGLPYDEYFKDIEAIFRAFGGRPHWAKKHSLSAAELKKLYPKWEQFQQLRRQFDPDGIFLNDYLKKLFTGDEHRS